MNGIFSSVLKTAKVIIVQSPCYQMLKEYLKNLCTKDCIPFLITIILSITCSLANIN